VPLAVPQRDLHRHFYIIQHKQKYRSEGIALWLSHCETIANEVNESNEFND